jgi:nucleotide-binding universal stress UspA family protein
MKRFKNILVLIDSQRNNDVLLERAVTLAKRNNARLTVIDVVSEGAAEPISPIPSQPVSRPAPSIEVVEELPREFLPPEPKDAAGVQEPEVEVSPGSVPRTKSAIKEYIVEVEAQTVQRAVEIIRQEGIEVTGQVLVGRPYLETIRQVLRAGHDLVMSMAEGPGGLRQFLFGSTTMHLMRKCPCPVWVLKPNPPRMYRRILAAVDPDPMREDRDALNRKIMDLATSLALSEQSELWILHSWLLESESVLRSKRSGLTKQEVDELAQQTGAMHRQYLLELLDGYPLDRIKHEVYLIKGEAADHITAMANQIDLIVMGTVGRTGVAGVLIGDTAENVMRNVNCSVMAVKPEGFQTPVQLPDSR